MAASENKMELEASDTNKDEQQYLDLVQRVLTHGSLRDQERTGTGTLAIFGATCRYDLSGMTLPLFTTKHVSFKNVLVELIFFLLGKSHTSWLEARGCKIWKGNSSREYLDSVGLQDYPAGQLGPVYGCQWRHFGGEYMGADAKTGDSEYGQYKGIDQLADVIQQIKSKPQSRRHLVVAWNPEALSEIALPACHCLFQFFVDGPDLSCLMYQRSADLGLGVPYNVASYSLLTHIVAHLTGLKAKEFIHVMGDCHVYVDHKSALEEQCTRQPKPFPTIRINPQLTDLDALSPDDISLHDYQHHPRLKMKMAV